jgi:hypothetical protein
MIKKKVILIQSVLYSNLMHNKLFFENNKSEFDVA